MVNGSIGASRYTIRHKALRQPFEKKNYRRKLRHNRTWDTKVYLKRINT